MCSINHDLKSIFIHLPKNGGMHIQTILEKSYNFKTIWFTREDHDSFNDYENRDNPKDKGFIYLRKKGLLNYYRTSKEHDERSGRDIDKWNNYYKFTIVRNPYDRLVSAWKYLRTNNKLKDKNVTFEEFIDGMNEQNDYSFSHGFITQYDQLLDENNEIHLDYVGRFENLNEELVNYLLKINVPYITHYKTILNGTKINSTGSNENYYRYYNEKTMKFVNEYFKKDFEYFKYDMCSNFEDFENYCNENFVDTKEFVDKNTKLMKRLKKENLVQIIVKDEIHEEVNKLVKKNLICDMKKNNEETEKMNFSLEKQDENSVETNEKPSTFNVLTESGLQINLFNSNFGDSTKDFKGEFKPLLMDYMGINQNNNLSNKTGEPTDIFSKNKITKNFHRENILKLIEGLCKSKPIMRAAKPKKSNSSSTNPIFNMNVVSSNNDVSNNNINSKNIDIDDILKNIVEEKNNICS